MLTFNRLEDTNSTIPYHLKLMVNKNKEEFWYTKANPYLPKGKVEINLFVADHIENLKLFCKMYGNQPVIPVIEIQPEEVAKKDEEKM